MMVLPSGVNKATGLRAALAELRLSPRNVVGIGDAENDHAFLGACDCGVEVANALPTVKESADQVTAGRAERVAEPARRPPRAATRPVRVAQPVVASVDHVVALDREPAATLRAVASIISPEATIRAGSSATSRTPSWPRRRGRSSALGRRPPRRARLREAITRRYTLPA